MVAAKPPKPRRLVSLDGHHEPAEGKELKLPAIPGATECAHAVLQPIPRVRPITPKGHTYPPQHYMPAPPPNPKKQIHRVKPLHSQLQKVSSAMDAGPCRAPTPIESVSYDPGMFYAGANTASTVNGVHLDLPSPVNVPMDTSPSGAFQTSNQERIVLSPSCLGAVSPVVSASKSSNKALDDLGAQMLKPVPPTKAKNGNHGGGARRRHYRS